MKALSASLLSRVRSHATHGDPHGYDGRHDGASSSYGCVQSFFDKPLKSSQAAFVITDISDECQIMPLQNRERNRAGLLWSERLNRDGQDKGNAFHPVHPVYRC